MWVDTPSPDQVLRNEGIGETLVPRRSMISSPYDASAEYGFFDAFGASFLRNNTVLSALHDYSAGDHLTAADVATGRATNYNPYVDLKQNYTPEALQQLAPAIDRGEFEASASPRLTKAIVDDLLYEADLQRRMEGSWGGALAGGLVTGFLDPTTYIPFIGQASRVGRLGKIGLFALNASLSAGTSEAVLQATQRDRSIGESLMNIGTAGVLGGGMGIFAAGLHPSETLHPVNPNNPLRPENLDKQGEVYRTPDGASQDVIHSSEIAALRDETARDLGAAAAPRPGVDAPSIARGTPGSIAGKAFRAAGDVFNSQTIAGRVIRATAKTARSIGVKLMDPGGILLDFHLQGKAIKPSAEAIKKDYGQEVDQLYDGMSRQTVAMNQKAKDLGGKKVDHADVLQVTQRKLFNMQDPELEGALSAKYGPEKMKLIDEAAGKNAEEIHSLNDIWEKRLQKEGLLQDTARVATLQGEVGKGGSLVQAIDNHPGQLTEATDVQKTELRHLRDQRDLKRAELGSELAKAVPLGRGYGHAQLWNREAIIESPADFKAFLMDAFAVNPSAEWLHETHNMTPDNLAALRQEDTGAYRSILQGWAGDEHYWRISRSEQELHAVQEAQKSAHLDLSQALVAAHAAQRDEAQLTLSEARKRRDVVMTRLETARARKRALEAERRAAKTEGNAQALNRANKELTVLEARAASLDAKLRKVEDLHTEQTSMRRQLEEDVRLAREDRKIAATDVRAVKRELLKIKGQTPMEDMVDETIKNLTRTGTIGPAIMDRINELGDRTTGRVKQRVISLSPEQRIEGIKKGWLNQDISQVLYRQYNQLSSELAVREGVGIGKDRPFSSWEAVTQSIKDEYNAMIAAAPDKATKDKLRKERDIIGDDIVEARNRLKGNFDDDGTTSGWLKWGTEKFRQANYLRYGGGFLLSSLTDTATVALRHPDFLKYVGTAIRELRVASREHHSELRSMIQSVELGMSASASAKRFGAEDLIHGANAHYGIGFGRTRRITGTIDRGFDKLGHAVSTYSGLPLWNRFWKTVSGIAMANNLNKLVMGYDKLKPSEIADLASLGIGKAEAARMQTFLTQHGTTDKGGRFEPHIEKWGDSEAAMQASRDFRIAIMRDMDRAVNTPGIGDTPRLMSKWFAKALLQFQTFAFTFLNRYAYPVAQRTSLFKERQAIMSMGILFASSTFVMIGHDIIAGRDPADRLKPEKLTQTLHEIIDRSGFLGWTSPYADSALKLTSPITGYGGTNRYARNSWVDSMLGVNWALLHDIDRAAGAAVSRDPKLVQKLLALAPFSTQARLFYNQLLNN